MTTAIFQLTVTPKRMLTETEAADHCGRPIKRFRIECRVKPVKFPNGDRRYDVRDLDAWLDSLKAESSAHAYERPVKAKVKHGGFEIRRKTRTPVNLNKFPTGAAGFFDERTRIAAVAENAVVEEKRGTLGMLIADYKAAPAFLDLAPRTQSDYQGHFNYLGPIADIPLMEFDRPLVVRIRDKAADEKGRRFGDYLKATLSVVFNWGCVRGYMADNPASGIKAIRRPKGAPDANRPWSDAEREAVLEAAPEHIKPAIALMMFTGLGPKDALTLSRNHWKNGAIATRRAKTGEPVYWPIPMALDRVLRAAPPHSAATLCASSYGRPWTVDGFRTSWDRLRKALEAKGRIGAGLTLYGLRHTVGTILAEMGFDDRTIADALGQRTEAMARHYSRRADRRKKMAKVVVSFDEELDKRGTKAGKSD